MKKLSLRILILVIAFIILSVIEYEVMGSSYEINYVQVYVAKEKIKAGALITEDLVKQVKIQEDNITSDMMRSIPKAYATVDFEENQIIYHSQLNDESPMKLVDDQRMITVKCSIVEGNGWLFGMGERVDVILVSPDDSIVIEDAIVCRMFNETYNEEDPNHISLIVTEKEALLYFQRLSKSQVFVAKKH